MKVAVLLANGFETIEGLTIVDIMRRAEVCCHTFGVDSKSITTSHNIEIQCDKVLSDEVLEYDIVVLPGGMPGATNLRDNDLVNKIVKKFYDDNKIIAAICAGPITLGKLNLLEGKNVTCYPGFQNQLGNCNYKEDLVVSDGNIITGKGPAASAEFAFEVLKRIDLEKVNILRKGMLFEQ